MEYETGYQTALADVVSFIASVQPNLDIGDICAWINMKRQESDARAGKLLDDMEKKS